MEKYKLWDVSTGQSFHVMAKNKRVAFEYLSYIAKLHKIPVYKRIIRYYDLRKEYVLYDYLDDINERLFLKLDY